MFRRSAYSAMLCSCVLAAAAAGRAMAQTPPPFDRAAGPIAIVPAKGGGFDIHATWQFGVEPLSILLNLSTEVVLHVNGTPVASQTFELFVDTTSASSCMDGTNCGGSCGNYTLDGFADLLLCTTESVGPGGPDCACKSPRLTATFPGVPLDRSDQIMILIRPTLGAPGDSNTANDTSQKVFDGDPVFWNRHIANVRVVGERASELAFEVKTFGNGFAIEELSLAHETVIRVNGVQVNSDIACEGLFLASPDGCEDCGNTCTAGACGGGTVTLQCEPHEVAGLQTILCYCTSTHSYLVPLPGPVEPDDEIIVLLRPAPGALPELPGLEGDDEEPVNPCPADLDGDGTVDGADLAALLALWNGGDSAGDINGDGNTDGADLAALLAAWGDCFGPV